MRAPSSLSDSLLSSPPLEARRRERDRPAADADADADADANADDADADDAEADNGMDSGMTATSERSRF